MLGVQDLRITVIDPIIVLSHYFHNWWKLQRRPIPNSYTYVNAKKENVAKCSKSKECESEQKLHVR